MKSVPSRSASPAAKEDKVKISKQELEKMIEQEVHSAMKKKESRLDALIDMIQQQLEHGSNYESSIKILEARMMTVIKRAEAACAHMAKTNVKNPVPSLDNIKMTRSHSEEDSTKNVSQSSVSTDLRAGTGELMVEFMKELERLRADNAALKAAVEDLTRERSTPSPSFPSNNHPQNRVIEGLARLIKKEEVDHQEDSHTPTPSMSLKRPQVEDPTPEDDRSCKRIKSEPEELPYPPLPEIPFTNSLSPEAASYSIPPKLKVEVVLIKNPPQLSVFWREDEEDPQAPPMESYRVLFTTEQAKDSGVFQDWQNFGEFPAAPLPMFSVITKFRLGHKICVTVVGKDKFGRYGPYAKVACHMT